MTKPIINMIETIYVAHNKVSRMYFKNETDANNYAGECGTAAKEPT